MGQEPIETTLVAAGPLLTSRRWRSLGIHDHVRAAARAVESII
jgi:hypothetical protein